MKLDDQFIELLVCPLSGEPLSLGKAGLHGAGAEHYPLVAGIPWLLPEPRNSLLDWGSKLNHFQQVLLSEIAELEEQSKQAHEVIKPRLQKNLEAKRQFTLVVTQLLEPLKRAKIADKKVYDSLRNRAPSTQNLLSYEANLYRDWIWGAEENKASLEIVAAQCPSCEGKKLLVLGAGAGRLAYDLHQTLQPQMSVMTDINPMLLLAAKKIFAGESFELAEFPMHPRSSDYVAVLHKFSALEQWPENLYLAFADATSPAFKPAAFDLVLTPWLIDIQPHELKRFLIQLNQYLPVGGIWVNFGSLVFNQQRDSLCYSIDEVSAIARQAGFVVDELKEHEIPYLKSPYNAGYRMERVWTWRAEKVEHVPSLSNPQVLPSWLLDAKLPIPSGEQIEQFVHQHRSYAMLAAEVDGRTSLRKISNKYAKQNKSDPEETEVMLRQFFFDLYQQGLTK